jgi:hypothetical protein
MAAKIGKNGQSVSEHCQQLVMQQFLYSALSFEF